MKTTLVSTFFFFAAACCMPFGAAAKECRQEVVFAKGATTAQVKGVISGYSYCDYLLRARKGQRLTVHSTSRQADTMLQGPMEQLLTDDDPVTLIADGVYTVRVLMPRALARKGAEESYTLNIAIVTPSPAEQPAEAATPVVDAHNAKNSVDWPGYYHAVVPCASCPGIDTWLLLTDQTNSVRYSLTENYLEEEEGFFQSAGQAEWGDNGSTLVLKGADESRVLFIGEGAVSFLSEGQNIPEENSKYWLDKVDAFTGNQEVLLVNPAKVDARMAGQKKVVSIKESVMNFDHPTDSGHQSLKADLEIYCAAQQYAMSAVTYYEQPFTGGKVIDQGDSKEDLLEFSGKQDVLALAAEYYCH